MALGWRRTGSFGSAPGRLSAQDDTLRDEANPFTGGRPLYTTTSNPSSTTAMPLMRFTASFVTQA